MNVRAAVHAQTIRCAVYTRKSSEEGLDQTFNSLHAQREACEAYIKSQTGEGWSLVEAEYDDGGYSGGDMDRPALKRLLADIAAGEIDVVVVYKVDRLTRALSDFARIVDIFDKAGASFVSVTQAFNTTTSMGRLTLNVLLSFAQFEREVTGERIRDKIAASKAKGMWMGGVLPLGYSSKDHRLVVEEAEADQVRAIFRLYLKLGSVHLLADELEERGIRSKAWVTTRGRPMGGKVLSRGALFHLLQNRHYVGEIVHKEKTYPGLHQPIVERKLFDAVQRKLEQNRIVRRRSTVRPASAPLTGRIVDADGMPLSPTFSYGRHGRLYRYYVATELQKGREGARHSEAPRRLPADALERFVLETLRRLSGLPSASWAEAGDLLCRLEVRGDDTHLLLNAPVLFKGEHPDLALEDLRARLAGGERAVVEVGGRQIRVALPRRLQFRGGRTWSSIDRTPTATDRFPNPALVSALRRAHLALAELGASHAAPPQTLAHARAPGDTHTQRLTRLAFLAPDLQQRILEGRHSAALTVTTLLSADIPLGWADQRSWWNSLA